MVLVTVLSRSCNSGLGNVSLLSYMATPNMRGHVSSLVFNEIIILVKKKKKMKKKKKKRKNKVVNVRFDKKKKEGSASSVDSK